MSHLFVNFLSNVQRGAGQLYKHSVNKIKNGYIPNLQNLGIPIPYIDVNNDNDIRKNIVCVQQTLKWGVHIYWIQIWQIQ